MKAEQPCTLFAKLLQILSIGQGPGCTLSVAARGGRDRSDPPSVLLSTVGSSTRSPSAQNNDCVGRRRSGESEKYAPAEHAHANKTAAISVCDDPPQAHTQVRKSHTHRLLDEAAYDAECESD